MMLLDGKHYVTTKNLDMLGIWAELEPLTDDSKKWYYDDFVEISAEEAEKIEEIIKEQKQILLTNLRHFG